MLRKSSTPLDVALAELAGRQWGVVSLAQLRALSIGSRAVQLRAQNGRLRRVHRGVYAVGGATLPREGRWLAAVMACGPHAVLSHVSAAVHWNLLNYEPPRPEVTAPASRTGVPGIRLHRSRSSMPRTPPTTKASRPRRCTARCSTSRRKCHSITSSERSRRPSACASSYATHGLPRLSFNVSLDAPDHPGLEVDCYFPTHRLVVETDGWETHRTRRAFEDDRAKDAALLAAGYRVVRFTWRQLRHDLQTVADRLTAILRYTSASASRNSASSASSME
jgi:hypothetical protein